jgi:hypothetical protein
MTEDESFFKEGGRLFYYPFDGLAKKERLPAIMPEAVLSSFEVERVLLVLLHVLFNVMVNKNTVAVLTDHHPLTLADFQLLLRGDSVEATTTSIPFHRYHAEAVAVGGANAVVAFE